LYSPQSTAGSILWLKQCLSIAGCSQILGQIRRYAVRELCSPSPVRIHVSLGCDRLSWHSSQKFASESANIIRRALFSVVALHFGRLCGYEKRIESVRMQRARGAGRSGCGKEVHHRPHHFLPRPPPSLRWYIRGRGCRARSLTPALVAVTPCRIVGRGRGRIRCLGRRGAFGACLSIRWQFQ
jgi:hypothetical protein